jgi:hypothetical protein
MQSISPVTSDQLLAPGQEPLAKFEIYVGTSWINLCDLDGKNYVQDWSISLGGASMSPAPIGGIWSVTLSNENSIFHPKHPTSAYKDYLKTGRKVRISIGAKYGGTPYYWQRVIGFMDEPKFSAPDYIVTISGADYMKLLEDTELKSPDNYWGSSQTFDSIASDGLVGSEIYHEIDAMDIYDEANNVNNWTPTNCSFASYADGGGGSTYVGRMSNILAGSSVKNSNVGSATAGKQYKVKFKHKVYTAGYEISIRILQNSALIKQVTYSPTTEYTEETFYFTATTTGAIEMEFYGSSGSMYIYFDQISIQQFIPYWERYYELPGASKGAYYVTLDGSPVWQGEEDEGWFEEESTRRVFFDINKEVENGTNNLVIYYFTAESPENAVADLLVKAGLYANRAAALAAMEYTATGISIDRIWFDAGSTCLAAIKKLCERCDYRFYFKYDGTPVFKPKPSPGSTAFTFTDPKHIASASAYQDRNEIRNSIVIEGMKQAEPVNKEETMPPELKGEDHDDTSIAAYGERTLTIRNHLFQDQTSIDNMCSSLLAEYKDPKLYDDIEVPFNPVPLELADKISWKERFNPTLQVTQTGVIRDVKIDSFNTIYRCETE